MFDESGGFTESVYWFLNKSVTEKDRIIEDPGSLEEEENEKFFRIVGEVRKALATHSKDDVIKGLIEFYRDFSTGKRGYKLTPLGLKILEKLEEIEQLWEEYQKEVPPKEPEEFTGELIEEK